MSLASYYSAIRSFADVEMKSVRQSKMPWRRRLWLYRHGFLSSKDAIWNLTTETKGGYLSDSKGLDSKLRRINHPYDVGVDNKVLFPLLVSPTHNDLLGEIYGIVRGGSVISTDRLGSLESFDQLIDLLGDEPVVAKPTTAAQGDGVRVLDCRDGQFYCNDRAVTEEELLEELSGGRELILQENLTQADYAANIYPGSVNTVRILTLVDPETGTPFIAAAMHRFGTSASGTIDNASSGGISAGIDIETGELGELLVPSNRESGRYVWTDAHPDTGTRVVGTEIPEWNRVKERLLDLVSEYGTLWPQVGWDVVVRDDQGTITVLEGNPAPGIEFIQAHYPLLADERVRRFYEHHGVI